MPRFLLIEVREREGDSRLDARACEIPPEQHQALLPLAGTWAPWSEGDWYLEGAAASAVQELEERDQDLADDLAEAS